MDRKVEALVVLDGLQQLLSERVPAAVLGQVQQVKAGVSNRQVVLPSSCGLNDQRQALHAEDRDS
ncbi:hypothetical protein DNTS_009866, partial [Danionella cerebrum]